MPNEGLSIKLSTSERVQLKSWEAAHDTPHQVAMRCRIILRALADESPSTTKPSEIGLFRRLCKASLRG